jgi:hypothetical protein
MMLSCLVTMGALMQHQILTRKTFLRRAVVACVALPASVLTAATLTTQQKPSPPPAHPRAPSRPARTPVALGATISRDSTFVSTDPGLLDQYANLVGGMPSIVNIGGDWVNAPTFKPYVMDYIHNYGSTPMWTWEPADVTIEGPQPAFTDREITAGRYDGYIHNFARAAKAWGYPFFIRFAHEMNGDWYPWATGKGNPNGNEPADFTAMWRYVHGIFRDVGAHNVAWVWCVNTPYPGSTPISQLYPGNDVVDWIGIDGYNHGGPQWQSLQQVFGDTYATVTAHTSKPIMFSEVSSSEEGGSKAQWITSGFLDTIPKRFPRVHAVLWFDWRMSQDWRVNSSAASLAAFRKVVGSPLYKGHVQLP